MAFTYAPMEPDKYDYNVFFRNPDGQLGKVLAEGYESYEHAIDAVMVALLPEGFEKPFLVLLEGGK